MTLLSNEELEEDAFSGDVYSGEVQGKKTRYGFRTDGDGVYFCWGI